MRLADLFAILASVSLSTVSQVLLKGGMTSPAVHGAIQGGQIAGMALAVLTSPLVIGGVACFGLSLLIWLAVLSRAPLSLAYPFVALGVAATVLAGAVLFQEAVNWAALLGVGLIVAGVVIVGFAS